MTDDEKEAIRVSIREALEEYEEEKRALRAAENRFGRVGTELRTQLRSAFGALLGIPGHELTLGSWDCPPARSDHDYTEHGRKWFDEHFPPEKLEGIKAANPYGKCVYHQIKDPCCDQCLFCGNPDERK